MGCYPLVGSSQSSDRSSRGCTPPLTKLSRSSPIPNNCKTTPGSESSSARSARSASKLSDASASHVKTLRHKKKSSKSKKMSTDISQDSSSVFTPSQPSASQPSTPNPRANSKT